jgi:hypothetical protein
MLETTLKEEICKHLDHLKLLKNNMKGCSCLSNLIFFEDVTRAVDAGFPVDVLYLDFAKRLTKYHIVGL